MASKAGLTRLAKEVVFAADNGHIDMDELAAESSRSGSQGFFSQVREGLFGVLFVMAKETHIVKRRHVVLLFINLLQVCGRGGGWEGGRRPRGTGET